MDGDGWIFSDFLKIQWNKVKNLLKSGGAVIEKPGGGGKALIVNFKYKKNKILEELTKNEREKELGIMNINSSNKIKKKSKKKEKLKAVEKPNEDEDNLHRYIG